MASQRSSIVNISEIFPSLQGEGIYAGERTIFIRFAGCNLISGCSYCDTLYARTPGSGEAMGTNEVLRKVTNLDIYPKKPWACITGGEPLAQSSALRELIEGLIDRNFPVEIETNGTLPKPSWWTKATCWVADMKCPSSGITSKPFEWFDMREQDQIKFVVGSYQDLQYTEEVLINFRPWEPHILLSPVMPNDDLKFLQECWAFCIEKGIRYSPQLHKMVWGDLKGV